MSGHLLGVAAVAALAAAGLVRKGSLSERTPVTNEDLANALRAYRPPAGSAAKRGTAVEVSPQDFPGQSRLPGFTDDDLVRLGLARRKDEAPSTKKRRSRKKPVDANAEADLSAEQALSQELSEMASLEMQKQAAEATLSVTRTDSEDAVPEIGASASWTSETRENVSGTSTVTGREASRGDLDCITVTDVVIIEGEETRAEKRMCRAPGSARYSIIA